MKITIEKYNPGWINHFSQLHEKLEKTLIGFQPMIEHTGSTAVPNLSTKPIIDIAVGIKSKAFLNEVVDPMKNIYTYCQKKLQ